VYVDYGRVVLEERGHLLARLQDEAIAAAGHAGSAVDELLADRRVEAARVDEERFDGVLDASAATNGLRHSK
jgi:hypothetical protein